MNDNDGSMSIIGIKYYLPLEILVLLDVLRVVKYTSPFTFLYGHLILFFLNIFSFILLELNSVLTLEKRWEKKR